MVNKYFEFFNLHSGEEQREKVLENVTSNISFKGANLWILACAIVICSIGLNVNSTAVIIGAMLISPLMGPIVVAGFALAIYDFDLLKRSVKNLAIATLVSLVVAFLYFLISPFKESQSELLARTSPNIYDVLIAFFGGLVGVVAITRVEKGNPIPGVAIATALMPPLCTAGFGMSIGKMSYFFGAFYLYTINCTFICISTFLIVKYLKYPPVKKVVTDFEKRIRYGITGITLALIIPSFFLAYGLLQDKKYDQKVEEFITNELVNKGYTLVYKQKDYKTNPKQIIVACLINKFSDSEVKNLNERLTLYGIKDTELVIRQDNKDLKSEILNELGNHNQALSEKDIKINTLQRELVEYKIECREILDEIYILFPQLKNVSIGKHQMYIDSDSAKITTVVLYEATEDVDLDFETIKKWLGQKLETEDIIMVQRKQ